MPSETFDRKQVREHIKSMLRRKKDTPSYITHSVKNKRGTDRMIDLDPLDDPVMVMIGTGHGEEI